MKQGWPPASRCPLLHLLIVPLALIVCALPPAALAATQPLLLVQSDLADLRPGDITGVAWSVVPPADLANALCATRPDATARMALTSSRLTRRQRDVCAATADGTLTEWLIGRRAVLAMTLGAPFPLTSDILYRALASMLPGPSGSFAANQAARWQDVDPSLPNAAIRVLLPSADTIEYRIITEIILYESCAARGMARLPADPKERFALCTAVRTDATVARRSDKSSVTSWLRGQGDAAVALIGIATLLAEPELETALPLDGVTPSFATIADGQYKAVLPVYLDTVMPAQTAPSIAAVAGSLLAETAFGPLGKLPHQGLAPLAAAERIKLRVSLDRQLADDAH